MLRCSVKREVIYLAPRPRTSLVTTSGNIVVTVKTCGWLVRMVQDLRNARFVNEQSAPATVVIHVTRSVLNQCCLKRDEAFIFLYKEFHDLTVLVARAVNTESPPNISAKLTSTPSQRCDPNVCFAKNTSRRFRCFRLRSLAY